ncbi:MAG: hypothetical protein A2Z14_05685 [Chloroflexi bacterium RBG_16_48_8]|nr:MAG: hypothetical protein A2Z14_05685 [Chloroflexi bacterium RBG_16_48_8]
MDPWEYLRMTVQIDTSKGKEVALLLYRSFATTGARLRIIGHPIPSVLRIVDYLFDQLICNLLVGMVELL